jgi:hypothetical protein
MKWRCYNRNHPMYYLYGGLGIKVCTRWLNSFEAFLADMGPRPPGYRLVHVHQHRLLHLQQLVSVPAK